MKSSNNNIFKYIFAIVVIGLAVGAIYILYYSKNNNIEEVIEEESENKTESEISIVENIKMGVSNFDTMNPLLTSNKEIINISKLIFEPLVEVTEDYHVRACLAKSFEKIDDKTYQIKIDNSIKWQDGTSFIAKDIQFTVEKIKEGGSIYMPNVEHIESVETPDAETAILKLNQNVEFLEYYLDFPILPSTYYFNEDFKNSSKIPLGTGMYKIASIDNDNILLIRNDRWRNINEKTPKTSSITIHKYNAVGEMFNTFKLGNIDVINTHMADYSNYVGTIGYNKKEYKGRSYDFLSFNCEDSILSSKEVRKAINYSINKNDIVSSVLGNSKFVSNGPLDYGSYLYNEEGVINQNQDEAKKILQDDGWTYTNNRWQKSINGYVRKLVFNLIVNEGNQQRIDVANNIKKQLADVGIVVNVVNVNDEKYYEYLQNKNYQMILTGVNNSISPDLSYFYGDNNIANYNNDNIKSKLNSVDNFAEIQKIANEEVPYIGLYRNKGILILNANMGGEFKPNSYFTYYNYYEWYRQV